MTDQDKIAMLLAALKPFAELLEYPQDAPTVMELEVWSADVETAQKTIAAVQE